MRSKILFLPIVALTATTLTAQTVTIRQDVERAAAALQAAENAGAPLYARALHAEALKRLNAARGELQRDKRSERDNAQMHALEAYHAARAAEAVSRYMGGSLEAESLRVSIRELGGRVADVEATMAGEDGIARGQSSRERVAYARSIYDRARSVAAQIAAPDDMRTADGNLTSAERIVRSDKNNTTADHLAFVAEMLARRAEAFAWRGDIDRSLPGLRLERTRLAESASVARAARERQAREEAERKAAELRAQLEREATSRQLQQDEVARLRRQIEENDQMIRARLDEDRRARLQAERELDDLRVKYQAALSSSADPVEIERMRRQVEDQAFTLRSVQERERLSEASMTSEIQRLQQELDRTRREGSANAQTLSQREGEVIRMNQELQRMQNERGERERQRAEAEKAQLNAIASAENARRQAEEESAKLRQQVTEERERAEQARVELSQTREEMAQRDRSRSEDMQRALAAIAQTRSDPRGFIVTLPGIFFDTGKSTLKPGARNVLSRIADQLLTNPNVKMIIEGHTDSVGSDESNMALSNRRAETVRDLLAKRGVAAASISIEAKGETAPIATNDTAAGRQQNRRVELVIQ